MATIELIGVPFDGYGRLGNQARAAAALRQAGIESAFSGHRVVSRRDIILPAPSSERSQCSGVMNEPALLVMTDILNTRVRESIAAGHFPFIYGADCSVLLGAFTGFRDAVGEAGLLLVDAHEDTTPLDVSTDGEAANMEIALLLGMTGQLADEALRRRLPALKPEVLAMLGQRDHDFRRGLNVASLRERGVWLRRHDEVASDPADRARAAVEHVRRAARGWWLHTDLDVLAQDASHAQRVPGDQDEEGGLNWTQLSELMSSAFSAGGVRGWSLVIYNPEQDEDGREAQQIVHAVTEAAKYLPV